MVESSTVPPHPLYGSLRMNTYTNDTLRDTSMEEQKASVVQTRGNVKSRSSSPKKRSKKKGRKHEKAASIAFAER